jgi:hypothetical protein
MPLELREHLIDERGFSRRDLLLTRAELLNESDRDLFHAVFVCRQSVRGVARLMGVSRGIVAGRLRGICRHLASRRFLNAARALPYLKPEDAELARRHFCQRTPQAKLAGELGLSRAALRRQLVRIRAQIDLLARARRDPRRAR